MKLFEAEKKMFFSSEDGSGKNDGGMSQREFYEQAPIIGGADEESQLETEPDASDAEKPAKTEQDQPETESGESDGGELPDVLDIGDARSFKMGENTFARDDIERWKKDSENREKWVANLTNRGKIMSWLQEQSPENQDRFIAYAMLHLNGKQELPEDFKTPEFAFDVTLKDEYEADVKGKYSLKPGTPEYEKVKQGFYNQFKEEHKQLFTELYQHQNERRSFETERARYEARESAKHIREFVIANNIDFPTEGDLLATVQTAFQDPSSPYRKTASMLVSVAQYAESGGMNTLQEAYNDLFGKQNNQKAAAKANTAKAKNSQNGVKQEKPGKSNPPKSAEDQWLEKHQAGSERNGYHNSFEKLMQGN